MYILHKTRYYLLSCCEVDEASISIVTCSSELTDSPARHLPNSSSIFSNWALSLVTCLRKISSEDTYNIKKKQKNNNLHISKAIYKYLVKISYFFLLFLIAAFPFLCCQFFIDSDNILHCLSSV